MLGGYFIFFSFPYSQAKLGSFFVPLSAILSEKFPTSLNFSATESTDSTEYFAVFALCDILPALCQTQHRIVNKKAVI